MKRFATNLALLVATVCIAGAQPGCSDARRIRSHLNEAHNWHADIEVERVEPLTLPGFAFYKATLLIMDHPGYRCTVHDTYVWCNGDDPFDHVVEIASLGSSPEQLDDEQWLALVNHTIDVYPILDANNLEWIDGYITPEARSQITPPSVDRPADGGVQITLFFERISYGAYPSGNQALVRLDVTVEPSNTVAIVFNDVWDISATTEANP